MATKTPPKAPSPQPSKVVQTPGPSNWNSFVQSAQKVSKETGFPLAVMLGQAALETGRNPNNAPGHNWFGIKGAGTAGSNNLGTKEFGPEGYYSTNSDFRAYNNPEESIRDYVKLIQTQYPKAWEARSDPAAMIKAIHEGGYATSPTYVQNVMSTPEFKAASMGADIPAQEFANQFPQLPDEQTPPIDPNIQMPQVDNIAGQSIPYPLRSVMSSLGSQGQNQASSSASETSVPTMPSNNLSPNSAGAYNTSQSIQKMYGGYIAPAQQAAPTLPQDQQSTPPPTSPPVDQGPQTYQQGNPQSYTFGPITISSII